MKIERPVFQVMSTMWKNCITSHKMFTDYIKVKFFILGARKFASRKTEEKKKNKEMKEKDLSS